MTATTSDFAPALAVIASQTATTVTLSGASTATSLPQYTSDPSTLTDGMEWFRSDTSQVKFRINGATAAWTAPQKYGTLIDIVSSSSETDILGTAGYTVAPNTLGSGGTIRAFIHLDYLNNTGGSLALPVIRVYFGGTKVVDTGTPGSAASNANRQAGYLQVDVQNRTSSTQIVTARLQTGFNGLTTGNGSSWGDTNGVGHRAMVAQNTASIDTTASALLRVTAQLSSSSASHELRAFASYVEFP